VDGLSHLAGVSGQAESETFLIRACYDTYMTTEISKESVKKLLDHWIEHNESHSASFRERAEQVAKVSGAAARDIEQAAALMDQCTEMLRKAMKDL
jgi:hypothetical protein